jgi:5-methyltetrahydrofolate--homocysteine methyltransferase
MATVRGDIHDIGKNLAKVLLENYGYDVIDLGKDVPIEEVVAVAKQHQVKLVGLSALMTTTVTAMEDTISALREADLSVKVFVGGAVLTEKYAKAIGADYYCKDARAGVTVAETVFGQA